MKETKELIGLALKIANATGAALEDGKVDFVDIVKFTPVVGALASGLTGLEMIPSELSKMTEAEYKDLIEWAKAEFDIPQDRVEERVELALDAGLKIAQLIMLFLDKGDAA